MPRGDIAAPALRRLHRARPRIGRTDQKAGFLPQPRAWPAAIRGSGARSLSGGQCRGADRCWGGGQRDGGVDSIHRAARKDEFRRHEGRRLPALPPSARAAASAASRSTNHRGRVPDRGLCPLEPVHPLGPLHPHDQPLEARQKVEGHGDHANTKTSPPSPRARAGTSRR